MGVEASADVAEETKAARFVIPRTMFYALATSIVIELLMYIVFVLAIRDGDAVAANTAAPIEEIISQQVGPVVTRIVVAGGGIHLLGGVRSHTFGGRAPRFAAGPATNLPVSPRGLPPPGEDR